MSLYLFQGFTTTTQSLDNLMATDNPIAQQYNQKSSYKDKMSEKAIMQIRKYIVKDIFFRFNSF